MFVEPDSTYCLMNQTFYWFNSTDRIPLRQLERMKQMHSDCPFIPGYGNCTCELEQMSYLPVSKCLTLLLFVESLVSPSL